jgi:carbamoyltransferase
VIILGINAYHADAAAALVVEGKLVAAAEEERFRRIKHWAGFPTQAIKYCLDSAGVRLSDVDHIAVNRNPRANLIKKFLFTVKRRPTLSAITARARNAMKVRDIPGRLAEAFPNARIKAKMHSVEHHRAHLASAFFVSPFQSAAVLSVDGFGDFVSSMWGVGDGGQLRIMDEVTFPHSLGLFYLALTQYLGFPRYGDEYKVMGLAPYGKTSEMQKMREIVRLRDGGKFELNLDYFVHHATGISMSWDDTEPEIGPIYTKQLEELFGPARAPADPIEDRHRNIAASLQSMYEQTFFHMANHLFLSSNNPTLCFAGGCAYNSVANGMLFDRSPFRDIYIQSAAGDAGGAIGAAYYVWNQELGNPRSFEMTHAYLGPEYTETQIMDAVLERSIDRRAAEFKVEKIADEAELCRRTAAHIAEGDVVGWFQGRMEWGPRALGNRSIVCDPRRADMKDILNRKIKRRESFRPFAPSILRNAVGEWFETDYEVPFMLQVYQIRKEKRPLIPAVTHVNGSGRLQSVTRQSNPRYYRLIEAFGAITGVPVVLNTSFNENEPVVNTPAEALDCFLRTKMDLLVMGNLMITRM